MSEEFFTISDIARAYGITEKTITSYKARGQMPPPDLQVGRTPIWKISTLNAWRPIPGHRTKEGNA